MATTYTNSTGNFIFPSRTNWWGPDNRPLNVFIEIVTAYPDSAVTDRLFRQYVFASSTTFLSHDGAWSINFPLDSGWLDYQAIWIFEDLRNAWNYVSTYDAPHNPGLVTAVWERNLNCYPPLPDFIPICGSFTYGGILTHFIYISNDSNTNSMDTVLHETGHMYVVNANGWWYIGCLTHSMFDAYWVNCAWSEGWADYFPLAVNGDRCYNFNAKNPCSGRADIDYYDLEVHSRADNLQQSTWGDGVEGRVAAALYDLYDSSSDSPGYDRISAGFLPIAQIALGSSQTTTFQNFWNRWKGSSGQNEFLSGLTLWWNTINYVNIRQNFLPAVMK